MVSTPNKPDLDGLIAWQADLARQADELRAEIHGKQIGLAQVEDRLALVTKLIEIETRGQADASVSARGNTPTDVAATGSAHSSRPGLEEAVEEILRMAGTPLHISSIREKLIAQGVPIPGRGDDANIIVRLRRLDNRFTRTARGTYGLAEWKIPALESKPRKQHRKAAR